MGPIYPDGDFGNLKIGVGIVGNGWQKIPWERRKYKNRDECGKLLSFLEFILPRIFDNIGLRLHPALADTLKISQRADFCVGYFNLRGWKLVDDFIEPWSGGEDSCCRLIVGMTFMPQDELRKTFSLASNPEELDAQTAQRLKKRAAEEFRSQLVFGAPNNTDEAGLRRLSAQLKAKKLVVKLFLRYPLHAKLYLIHRTDPNNPATSAASCPMQSSWRVNSEFGLTGFHWSSCGASGFPCRPSQNALGAIAIK